MREEQAKRKIRDTFENSFDKEQFTDFISNLLKKSEEAKFCCNGSYIPEAYRKRIKKLERIKKFSKDGQSLDVLIVTLQSGVSLERARTMQRNFIAWYLNGSRGGKKKDAALVAYILPGQSDWRFSLVKMDYEFQKTKTGTKAVEKFTPARRWSFLVGGNEKSHTAQSRFLQLLMDDEHEPTLAQLEEAFNIESVTKEFFLEYRKLFIRTKEALDKAVTDSPRLSADFQAKGVDTVNFAKKLLGQIVFLYFLQKKGFFGVGRDNDWGSGSRHFLRELFEQKHGSYKNFFNDILEPLFYEALRFDRHQDDDYYSRFNCKIPFLNGGLFDPINDYDWVHADIILPNELFSNTRKTKDDDSGGGILDVFDRYNFTVCEDEPLEKEVAIDPELLGKTYEKFNAIRPDNFNDFMKALKSGKKDEENKFNKSFGVYYTPREIVHYMCQQSLINYLYNMGTLEKLPVKIEKQDIEDLIEVGEMLKEHEAIALTKRQNIANGIQKNSEYTSLLPDNIRDNASIIDKWLADITVCDPAVGSGAFPVGMMTEIVRAREVLSVFLNKQARSNYELKHRCIEHSLYGVDIDSGAVEITKLRLWLSLVVDEENIKNIKPLPNLDYKIVCGNSLLGVDEDLFNNNLLRDLERLKKSFFDETNPTNKGEYRKNIDDLINKITEGHTKFDFQIYFSEVFHHKGGFDVLIANPPYVQLQKNHGELANLYAAKKEKYQTFERMGDIYMLFYELGIRQLRVNGILCYITSNKWMRAGYGEKLRRFFLNHNPLLLIDLGPGVFESATVDTSILILQKQEAAKTLSSINHPPFSLKAITLQKQGGDVIDINEQLRKNHVILEKLTSRAWFIGTNAAQRLKEKIECIGKPLREWDVNIYRGVLTGLNEAFIIDTPTKERLCAEDPKSAELLKPIIRGRDIKRYHYEWAGLWLIVIPAGWTNENRKGIISSKYIAKQFPALFSYLSSFEEKAKKRNDRGDYWWELRHCDYYAEFEKEKVVWQEISQRPTFAHDESGIYCNDTSRILTGKNLKYLIGIFNSSFFKYSFAIWYAGGGLGEKGIRFKSEFMKNYPLVHITSANKNTIKQIEAFVDEILTAQKQKLQTDTRALEREIDQLVYQLYGLTEEEIRIVEGV